MKGPAAAAAAAACRGGKASPPDDDERWLIQRKVARPLRPRFQLTNVLVARPVYVCPAGYYNHNSTPP